MTMQFMYVTNNVEVGKIAEQSGVDWIMVDLEINGKQERQGHLDTVISHHQIEDVKKMAKVLKKSELLVRVNPIYNGSKDEIDQVIEYDAEIIMLPFFHTAKEVSKFIDYVDNRAKVMLLLETPAAVEVLDDIISLPGISYIHVGLNDLHLGYQKKFMFELLIDSTVEKICEKLSKTNIPYGFGGIAQVGEGKLPAEIILGEHHRLGSSMVILCRSFCDLKKVKSLDTVKETFDRGIKNIKKYQETLYKHEDDFFKENYVILESKIESIVEGMA